MNLERLARLESYHLRSGSHTDVESGMCAMEFVAWLAEEPHSDAPECACPVLSAFVRAWNDSLPGADRDRLLKPVLARLVGSRSTPEVERQRGYLALDWMIREFLPTWLECVDLLRAHASEVRVLATIRDLEAAELAGRDVRAAGAAARATARDAVAAAAWDAARAAADAARLAADAARAADVAADAVAAAALDAAGASAATAVRDALKPTVAALQTSARDLLERMLRTH